MIMPNSPANPGPTISVVTICMNAKSFIKQTIESVLCQNYPSIEYIVVDGGSTDGTLEIIEEYESRITTHISEPDNGIANAMNKSIGLASGQLVLFLHADDYLIFVVAIARAVEHFDDVHDVFAFSLYYETGGARRLRQSRPFDWRLNFKTGILHQATLCRRDLFEKISGFDTSLKIAMDYDFFLRAYRRGIKEKVQDETISVVRDTGVSSNQDWGSLRERFGKERRVHFRYRSDWISWVIYGGYWALYLPYRWVMFSKLKTRLN